MAKIFEGTNFLRNSSATLTLSLLIACGQNAHVTSKDPAIVPVGSPISHTSEPGTSAGATEQIPGGGGMTLPVDPQRPGGGTPLPISPSNPACYELVKYRYKLEGVSIDERKSLELPYHQSQSRIRTLGEKESPPAISSTCARGCGPDLTPIQYLLKAEISGLPEIGLIGKIRRAEVALKIIRARTRLHGTELFCLLNERLCSGTRGSRHVNDEFWNDLSDNEVKYLKTQYVDEVKNEKIWDDRKGAPGHKSDKFVLDISELARGSRHNLRDILVPGPFEPSKKVYFGIADDVDTCSGELLIELEVNKCPPVVIDGTDGTDGTDRAEGSSS